VVSVLILITDLPTIRTNNSILVVVDRLTKMAHFTPCSKLITAEETTQLILDEIVRLHGLPKEIVSDRGPQFASKFWHRLFEVLGVDIRLSSAFHLETDGQTERTNQTLEQYLCCTVNYQ
jgi:transposase InsO family protein